MLKSSSRESSIRIATEERSRAIASTHKSRESFQQYFTPPEIANLAASLFTSSSAPLSLLDLGAGTGVLSVYTATSVPTSSITAVESDPALIEGCTNSLAATGLEHTVICGDALAIDFDQSFGRAILNPPYQKAVVDIPDDEATGNYVRTPNLYAAFIVKAINLLSSKGELVAIVPRSWMSGAYYKQFRRYLLSRCSLDSIIVFGSRTDVFSEFGVLQEICIVKLTKDGRQHLVSVAEDFQIGDKPAFRAAQLNKLVLGNDLVIATANVAGRQSVSLADAGFRASTGKIIMHRNGINATVMKGHGDQVPLIQVENLSNGSVLHPIDNPKKPQWLAARYARGGVIPTGYYVLVKRFSPKEEKRRLKGFLLEAREPVAVENHINILHAGTSRRTVPLQRAQAYRLLEWINSDKTESYFDSFASTTQVNAGDLNRLPLEEGL